MLVGCSSPPPLHGNRLRPKLSLHPRGDIPQVTNPSPPPPPPSYYANDAPHQTSHADTRACEPQMRQELPVGMHVQLDPETGSVCHFFWREYLTLKRCTCSTGATGMGSPATDPGATWAAGLAALLVKGLARGLATLGAGLAGGLAVGRRSSASDLLSKFAKQKVTVP